MSKVNAMYVLNDSALFTSIGMFSLKYKIFCNNNTSYPLLLLLLLEEVCLKRLTFSSLIAKSLLALTGRLHTRRMKVD